MRAPGQRRNDAKRSNKQREVDSVLPADPAAHSRTDTESSPAMVISVDRRRPLMKDQAQQRPHTRVIYSVAHRGLTERPMRWLALCEPVSQPDEESSRQTMIV